MKVSSKQKAVDLGKAKGGAKRVRSLDKDTQGRRKIGSMYLERPGMEFEAIPENDGSHMVEGNERRRKNLSKYVEYKK